MHIVQVDEGFSCPHVPDDNGIITAYAKQISHKVRKAYSMPEKAASPTGTQRQGKEGAGDETGLLGWSDQIAVNEHFQAAP